MSESCVGGIELLAHIVVVRDGEVEYTAHRDHRHRAALGADHRVQVQHEVGHWLHLKGHLVRIYNLFL